MSQIIITGLAIVLLACASGCGDDCEDLDADGICDDADICVGDDTAGDADGDGVCDDRDVCEGQDATGDMDGDRVCDDQDMCEGHDATGDTDGDGLCGDLDACQGDDAAGDTDGDGVCDDLDACQGDDAAGDTDGDGVCDDLDACQGDDAAGDTDGDGVCDDRDVCDGDDAILDADGDGICDDVDACIGDNDTGDTDGDGVCDDRDICYGDDATGDLDGDFLCSDVDNCDAVFNPLQEDVVYPFGEGDACIVVFVKADATGAADGSSWADAFTDLDAAVAAAQVNLPQGPMKQLWVAGGRYRASSANATVLTMVDGLEVYGGFEGDEGHLADRPATLAESIIDGDQAGDDVALTLAEVHAEQSMPDHPTRSDNASQVVIMANEARLDGVVVTGGYAETPQLGVGVIIPPSTTGVRIVDSTVRDNIGAIFNVNGAGLGADTSSVFTVEDTVFAGNIAWNGAGVFARAGSGTFHRVRFEGNGTIGGQGSGFYQLDGDVQVHDSRFVGNEMIGNGGGAFFGNFGTSFLANVLFDGNIGRRGAIQVIRSDARTFINVTVANHPSSGNEGAVWADANASFINAVWYNNNAGDLDGSGTSLPGSITHSCAEDDLSSFDASNIRLDGSATGLGDPFSVGEDGELFLANMAAGDGFTSACVDTGSTVDANADFPGWTTSTTRRDLVFDGAAGDDVDMGFHYGRD